jgi:hypothetical protein
MAPEEFEGDRKPIRSAFGIGGGIMAMEAVPDELIKLRAENAALRETLQEKQAELDNARDPQSAVSSSLEIKDRTDVESSDETLGEDAESVAEAWVKARSVALTWMRVPAFIGVVLLGLGVVLLIVALCESAVNYHNFTATLWAGVVLVSVGALSSTAVARMAIPFVWQPSVSNSHRHNPPPSQRRDQPKAM